MAVINHPKMPNLAYSWLISITDTAKAKKYLRETKAKHKAEICVVIDSVSKEFTFEDFEKRLGFEK